MATGFGGFKIWPEDYFGGAGRYHEYDHDDSDLSSDEVPPLESDDDDAIARETREIRALMLERLPLPSTFPVHADPRTSTTRTEEEPGGYDYHFLGEVPDALQCLICTLVACHAQQVDCCGRVFCQGCLGKLRRTDRRASCPNCREAKWNSFPDKKSVRDIQSLRVRCSNHQEGGCDWEGELRDLDKHVTKCSSELVLCKYSSIGCKVKVLKKGLSSHEEECTSKHLKLAMERIDSLTKRLQAVELGPHPPAPHAHVVTPPVVFRMGDFSQHVNEKVLWESPPFYTQPHGYKLYLQVNAFGLDGRGNRSLAVRACLMSGQYDDSLVWPFRGVIFFELMNQDADANHRSGTAKFLEWRETAKNRRVSSAQGKSVVGWGVVNLLLFSDLEYRCFVQRDSVYLRVSKVEMCPDNKPWLL